ncbi:conjugal transfer protein TraG, partial [Agrobacterium vitis]|nr:conjugal transfer protein TraG [Agrobacterium vitis]
MTANRLLLAILPAAIMVAAMILMSGMEHRLTALGTTAQAKLMLGRAGLALPYVAATAIGVVALFAANGSANIKAAGLSVLAGNGVVITIATLREVIRLNSIASSVPAEQSVLAYTDPVTMIGVGIAFISGMFALRVAIRGNAAFATTAPKRIGGKRAVHGEAHWMKVQEAAKLFPEPGGIVIGERYRVDRDSVAAMPFRADDRQSWGAGGKSPLLCFDGSFGSSHGI